jgi:AraC-like DNA-binding protein
MQHDIFSTRSLPAADQLEAWRGWFDTVFDVTPGQSAVAGFHAESCIWTLDGFAISRVSAPPLKASRTNAHIRRNPVDHWIITLGNASTGIEMPDASMVVPERLPFVLSLGHEFVSERSDDDRLQLYLARDSFRDLSPLLDAAQGKILNTPLGQLLVDYMLLLERSLPNLSADDLSLLKGALGAMIGACILPSADRVAMADSQIKLTRLEKVRQTIRKHLRSPSLGTDRLCRDVGVSRSQLYRLLEGEGGVARYIQRQRLLEAYATLSGASGKMPLATLANDLCFADASSFSRAFRHEFGVRPSDVRGNACAGPPPASWRKDRIGPEVRTLGATLRAL